MTEAEDRPAEADLALVPPASDDSFRTRFEAIFAETYPALVAYARRRSANTADADDVVAEVFATAWRRRYDLEAVDNSTELAPLPWLYGIAANVVRNSRRAGGRRLRLVERLRSQPSSVSTVAGSATAGGSSVADQPSAEVRSALDRLSFDDQEVLRLVAWEGLSHAEAGQALGCSANAVGIRMHRARQRLEAELGQ